MGNYTTMQLVSGRYPNATTRGGSTDQESYFIVGAEGELDGYLAKRYTVPMSPAPGFVVDLATDMAYLKMKPADKELRASVDTRIKMILDGSVTLTVSGGSLDTSGYAWAQDTYRSAFGPDDPVNWSPSVAKLEAAEDERDGD